LILCGPMGCMQPIKTQMQPPSGVRTQPIACRELAEGA
jgi:hypothetical protein